jgi:hypothetical protein
MGTAIYAPEKEALIWKIKSFPGGKVPYSAYIIWIIACLVLNASQSIERVTEQIAVYSASTFSR